MAESELTERVERLEQANRRLWFIAVGTLALLAAAIGFRAAYAAPEMPQKIVAHEFDVVDGSGNVRATFGTVSGEPFVRLTGANKQSLLAGPGLISLLSDSSGGASLVDIGAAHGSPSISLVDGKGFEMDLGGANVVEETTGATKQTSAASIVMFGNDKNHHVIWQAPQ